MAQVSVQDTVLTGIPGEPRLIGGKCPDCGNVVFPMQKDCPKCTGDQIEKVELSTKGVLWTWTIQGFPPKSPPYIGGDLGGNPCMVQVHKTPLVDSSTFSI